MIEVKIKNFDRLETALVKLEKNIVAPVIALKRIGVYMLGSIAKNFDSEGRPVRWKGLSPMAISMRKNKGSGSIKILQDTGFLRSSIGYKVIDRDTGVAIGTNVKYAKTHQFGASRNLPARVIKPKKKEGVLRFVTKDGKVVFTKYAKQKARTVEIPQRKFLLFQKEDIDAIKDIFIVSLKDNENNSKQN